MLKGIDVRLNSNFFDNREEYEKIAEKIVFTGMIDEYFNYKYGELEYRSLKFETEILEEENFQGNAVVNYTEYEIPYTRIIEHKHFEYGVNSLKTVITKEGGKVYCLRFADSGAGLSDKVIMIQGEKVVENSKYDHDMTELMNDKTQNGVRDLEDNDSKIYFTDSNGKTTELDLVAKPKDLSMEEKKGVNTDMIRIEAELEKEREIAEKIQAEIEQISNTLEAYEDNPSPEIMENVIEPATAKIEYKKGELSEVYEKIGSLNKERADILTSKGLDHLMPEAPEEEKTGVEGYESHYGHSLDGGEKQK